jgi:uncharacterized membrane protein (UPF0127 family)
VIPLLALMVLLGGCGASSTGLETVVIKGETFELEVAADTPSRTKGLMYRDGLEDHGGMLFIFPDPEIQAFWMANCLIDIDIIYLDRGGRITAMHRMKCDTKRENEDQLAYERRLPRYPSVYPAQFVIELKAGSLDRLDLRVEDKIELDLDRLKRLAQ